MDNLARILVDECGRSKAWIMLQTGAADQSVENWLTEQSRPTRYYAMILSQLVKRERARKEKK